MDHLLSIGYQSGTGGGQCLCLLIVLYVRYLLHVVLANIVDGRKEAHSILVLHQRPLVTRKHKVKLLVVFNFLDGCGIVVAQECSKQPIRLMKCPSRLFLLYQDVCDVRVVTLVPEQLLVFQFLALSRLVGNHWDNIFAVYLGRGPSDLFVLLAMQDL